jgi:hypothetical protein
MHSNYNVPMNILVFLTSLLKYFSITFRYWRMWSLWTKVYSIIYTTFNLYYDYEIPTHCITSNTVLQLFLLHTLTWKAIMLIACTSIRSNKRQSLSIVVLIAIRIGHVMNSTNINKTNNHLSSYTIKHIKRTWHMKLEILVLAWDRDKHIAV